MKQGHFGEQLLQIMERKRHWAWPGFTRGLVPRELLHVHLEQEYATYVRDFAVLLGQAYVQCPVDAARAELAENLYEEETGGLAAGRPHAELFLEIPRGLGMVLGRFDDTRLIPAAARYRRWLDRATTELGWEVATAVSTIFVEGTCYERGEIDPRAHKRPTGPLEEHPLVAHYGLPLSALALTRAHRDVEGSHRKSAWRMVLGHVPEESRDTVVGAMTITLQKWLEYRDGVAEACGLERGPDGEPRLATASCAS